MDFPKGFNCLSHEILTVKLDAYDFDKNVLKLVNSSHSYRKQKVKVNGKYRSWSEILFGVPRAFRAFIDQRFHMWHVSFFWKTLTLPIILATVEQYPLQYVVNNWSSILFKWLNDNYMKVNSGRSYLLVSGNVIATAKADNNHSESEK